MRHRRSGDLHEIHPPDAAVLLRRIRLAAGLVLLAYLATHLLNHALGLISLATMEAGRGWFLAFWRHPVGTLALYGAFATHVALALWSLYRRRHLRMPAWEAAQLLLGLLISPSWSRISSAHDWRTIGDTVNVASRLQELTKQYDCQLVISKQVVRGADVDGSRFPYHQVMVRNHAEPLVIYVIDDMGKLGVVT